MAVLTALAPDPRRPGYRVLELDRGRFASLPDAAIQELRLAPGAVLAPELLARLQHLADVEAAYRAAVRAQTRRPHAVADLGRRLIQKQHPPAAVEAALERLTIQGLIDDRRFAEHFVATRGARGRAPARLVSDLLRQGLDRRTAEWAVRSALAAEAIDVASTLRTVARRRAAQLLDLPIPARRRRLLAYLSRRGYRGSEIRDLVDGLVGAGGGP